MVAVAFCVLLVVRFRPSPHPVWVYTTLLPPYLQCDILLLPCCERCVLRTNVCRCLSPCQFMYVYNPPSLAVEHVRSTAQQLETLIGACRLCQVCYNVIVIKMQILNFLTHLKTHFIDELLRIRNLLAKGLSLPDSAE